MGEVDRHAAPPLHKINLSTAPRAQAADLCGSFHSLTLTAAVDEDDSQAAPVKACFSREVEQHWAPPDQDITDAGVTWWLPHGARICMWSSSCNARLYRCTGCVISVCTAGSALDDRLPAAATRPTRVSTSQFYTAERMLTNL